jgi:superfamily II DNA or RNA helicase
MAEFITKEMGIPAEAVTGGMSSKKGIAKRNKIIQSMIDGEIKVICATQVFKAGVDIPPLDTLYATCPMNNQPQLQQMLGRVRRAYEGKQTPTFRYFVDEGHGLVYGCARGTHKALVAEGADIILVPEGRKPESVGNTTLVSDVDGKIGRLKKKRGLRAAAARSPSGVSKLFSDLQDEARETKRYNERMGK